MPFTDQHLSFDDIDIGQEWESPSRTLMQADILGFAGLSGDFNPIHVDHEFARTTPFRQVIAHGLLVFSIASGLCLKAPQVRTLAFLGIRDWHFRGPVFIGDTIRICSMALEKEVRARGRRGMITWRGQILNQEGKIVQEGVTLTLVQGRSAARDAEGEADPEAACLRAAG